MADMSIDIDKVANIGDVTLAHVRDIAPVTIDTIRRVERIEKIAPTAVHIKELNQIDPLTVESLHVDSVRNLEPLNIDRLNVTHMPMMNLSLSRMPALDVNLRHMPALSIGLNQEFELPANYTIHTRLLGFEIMRFDIHGTTRLVPRQRARREQSHSHERSYPEVAAVGNPAIPNRCRETSAETMTTQPACAPPCSPSAPAPCGGLSAMPPCFSFSLSGAGRVGNGG
jgi:hypothetical protein